MIDQPQNDQVEVTVFGPGYGECTVVHVGDGIWVVVDSCRGKKGFPPASLQYFEKIGVDPGSQVRSIIISHWHDDHVDGAFQTIATCKNASICFSNAFTNDEFARFIAAYSTARPSRVGSGVDELASVMQLIQESDRQLVQGGQDARILQVAALSHGQKCEVWALSPSVKQALDSQARFNTDRPKPTMPMRRATPSKPNNHSVALWITLGDDHIILGADLETTNNKNTGWDAVYLSKNRPQEEVGLFKVPHHGSENGHHNGIWQDVLEENVLSIVTPWNRSKGLPGRSDLERMEKLTDKLFLTASTTSLERSRHDSDVEKMLKKFGVNLTKKSGEIGAVTARKRVGIEPVWSVDSWVMK